MATEKKATSQKGYRGAIFSNDVKDHSNDLFFVEKLEKAKIAVSKINLPEHMKK